MHARGADITQDDILYGLTLWKYYGLYLVVRASVRSVRDVEICLWLSLGAAAIVAVVAILQALQVFGVAELLATYYAPLGREQALDDMRGTSTIAAPQAVADVMTFNLAIAAGLVLRGSPRRTGLIALSLLLVFGALASGQFSGVLALIVGVFAFGYVTRRLTTTVLAFVPAAILAAVALRPVVERRIAGFDTAAGIPPSWLGRIENLQTYFLPESPTAGHSSWVRPAARVAAPIERTRMDLYRERVPLARLVGRHRTCARVHPLPLDDAQAGRVRRPSARRRRRRRRDRELHRSCCRRRPPGVRPTSDAPRRGRPLLLPTGALACGVHGHRRPCWRSGPSGASVTATAAVAGHRDNGVD